MFKDLLECQESLLNLHERTPTTNKIKGPVKQNLNKKHDNLHSQNGQNLTDRVGCCDAGRQTLFKGPWFGKDFQSRRNIQNYLRFEVIL